MTSATALDRTAPTTPLRQRRVFLGLSQADVERKSGVSREQILRLEQGRCRPTFRTARDLAAALGCEPEELFPLRTTSVPPVNGTLVKPRPVETAFMDLTSTSGAIPRIAARGNAEAAAVLGISEDTFTKHVAHQVPCVRLTGRVRLYPLSALAAWVEQNAERAL